MGKVPNFIFVGTAKAGTTSIYKFLKQHPSICIPQKETFHFLSKRFHGNKLHYPFQREKKSVVFDLEKYHNIFSNCNQSLIGEIGTGYLYYYKETIPEILKVLGADVKIFIVLRNPVDRAFSSYMHFIKDTRESLSFGEALDREEERIALGWDFMWHYKAMGMYYEQVKAYLENFKNVEILHYENLRDNPERFMSDILHKLNLESIQWKDMEIYNPSGIPKSRWLQNILMRENIVKRFFRSFYYSVFGKERVQGWRERVKNRNLEKARIRIEEKKYLLEYFKKDILALEKLLSIKTNWY